tara:strand:- start:10400 stop:12316 length:1917 start_codon:yes stop_codon:yes gene_type:complete
MSKINLQDPTSGYSSVQTHTANNTAIEEALNDKVLYRDNPEGEPNAMQNDLDMNSKDILNAKAVNVQTLSINGTQVTTSELAETEIPDQSSHSGKYLTTNGTSTSWDELTGADINYDSGWTGAVVRTMQAKLQDIVSVKDFGAVGDGSTDDTAAIQAGIDYLESIGGGVLFFPSATYAVTTATLEMDATGIHLEGSTAQGGVQLSISHTSGAGIHLKKERCSIKRMQIYATGARAASAADATLPGILIEADDESPADLMRFGEIDGVVCRYHPGDGILYSATAGPWHIKNSDIKQGKRHGLAIDNGTITGRTNGKVCSLLRVTDSTIFDNDGHGIFAGTELETVGSVENRCVRFFLENVEMGRNAESAGVRKSAYQMHAFGSQIFIRGCAFQGSDQAKTAATTGGISIAGNAIFLEGNRFLDVDNAAIRIESYAEFPTKGVWIRDAQLSSEVGQPTLDPVISIDSAAVDIYAEGGSDFSMDSFVPAGRRDLRTTPLTVVKGSAQSVSSSTTLVDDDTLTVPVHANQRSAFRATIMYDGPAAGDIKIAFTGPSGSTVTYGPSSGTRINTSDSIVVQGVVTDGTAIELGCNSSGDRCIEIIGQIATGGTAGNLTLQFAQVTSDATNTRILGTSSLQIFGT